MKQFMDTSPVLECSRAKSQKYSPQASMRTENTLGIREWNLGMRKTGNRKSLGTRLISKWLLNHRLEVAKFSS